MKPNFTDKLENYAKTNINAETGITISKDSNGNIDISDPIIRTGTTGAVPNSPSGYSAVADGHTHEYAPGPSAGHMWGMLERMVKYSTFQTRYMFAKDGTVFALTVNDRQAALDFLAAHPKEDYIAKDANGNYTGELNKTTDLYQIYYNARYEFWANGLGSDNADAAAKAYLLEKFNMGISLSKKEPSQSALKAINTTLDQNGNYSTSQCN